MEFQRRDEERSLSLISADLTKSRVLHAYSSGWVRESATVALGLVTCGNCTNTVGGSLECTADILVNRVGKVPPWAVAEQIKPAARLPPAA